MATMQILHGNNANLSPSKGKFVGKFKKYFD
jgi:hypothetical protein